MRSPGDASMLLRPAAEGVLRSWPVSRDVNSPRHDRSGLYQPELDQCVSLTSRPHDPETELGRSFTVAARVISPHASGVEAALSSIPA